MVRSTTGTARALAVLCVAVLTVAVIGAGVAGATKKSTTVAVATVPGVGVVLVDAQGKTLYTLTDASGAAVACTGACAAAWPPLTVAAGAKAKAPKGVTKISATSDGQVTWGSLPLYRFSGDTKAKQANGNGLVSFGGTWNVVKTKASTTKSTATTKASSSGGYGY